MNKETLETVKLIVEVLAFIAVLFKGSKWFGMVDTRLRAIDDSIKSLWGKVDNHGREISHIKGKMGMPEVLEMEETQ